MKLVSQENKGKERAYDFTSQYSPVWSLLPAWKNFNPKKKDLKPMVINKDK